MKRAYAKSQYAKPCEQYCWETYPQEADAIFQKAEEYYLAFLQDMPDLGENMMAKNMLDWFKILIKIGDDKFIKVPMGREPSVITAFTNRMWRWLKGEPASSAFAEYPSFAIEQLAPNNPLTNNIFAGITAMSTNKNWYGGDIVSSYMEEKPDYLQYDESTDAFSIWLGEITRHGKNGIEGLSPKKVNYLIDQYSGFIGDWVLPALSKKADVPAVVKAFVVDSVRQNRLGSDFYDALDEAKQVKETEFATAADDATYSYLYKQSKAAYRILLSDFYYSHPLSGVECAAYSGCFRSHFAK